MPDPPLPVRYASWDPSIKPWSYRQEIRQRLRSRPPLLAAWDYATLISLLGSFWHTECWMLATLMLALRENIRPAVGTSRVCLPAGLVALAQHPGITIYYLTDVALSQQGIVTGRAQGLLSFDRDMLRFESAECSFAISSKRARKDTAYPYVKMMVESPDGSQIFMMMRPHKFASENEWVDWKERFRRAVEHWLATSVASGGEEVFPPVAPHPRARHAIADAYLLTSPLVLLPVGIVLLIQQSIAFEVLPRLLASFGLAILGVLLVFAGRAALGWVACVKTKLAALESQALEAGAQSLPNA